MSLLLLVVACGKNSDDKAPSKPVYTGERLGDIEKSWKLVSVNDVEPQFTVYVEFYNDMFYIYQQVYSLIYEAYMGDYDVDYNIVSGTYADGTDWKCSYIGELSESGDVLTLTSCEKNPIVNVYEECTIPQEIIDEAETRATVGFDYHF